ncbi:MAG: trans-sulfuration enzyme family protein [Leptospirillia bacterium]
MESNERRGESPDDGFETQAIHGGDLDDPFRALTSPIYMTSTYTFPSVEMMSSVLAGESEGFVYSRAGNPTVAAMAKLVARLEGGEEGVAFASGMGAIAAVLFSFAKSRLPLIVSRHLYTGTRHFVSGMLEPLGIPVREIDLRSTDDNLGELREALRAGAGGVFCETPSNPSLDIVDLSAVAALCAEFEVPLAVDNTFPSPALQNPLRLGATIVIHSATKYLGGHGDLLGGVAVGSSEVIRKIAAVEAPLLGATLSPMNAWLILRGIKTLALRMEAHTLRATALARFFKEKAEVVDVRYPGLPSHPGHKIALRQMKGAGGMLSVVFAGATQARRFMNALRVIRIGVSLGDPASLAEHPATMSHRTYSSEERECMGVPDGLVRLSIGLESLNDLLGDVDRALRRL